MPSLPFGLFGFVCLLCGRPMQNAVAGPPATDAAGIIHMHDECRRATSQLLTDELVAMACRQVEWEKRARLN